MDLKGAASFMELLRGALYEYGGCIRCRVKSATFIRAHLNCFCRLANFQFHPVKRYMVIFPGGLGRLFRHQAMNTHLIC